MRGATIEEVGDRLDGDLLGDDPRAAALDAADRATLAVGEELPSGGKVHLSYGDEDMAEYVAQLTADHLIHGWDLAVATGGDTTLDDDLVEAVGAWFAGREEMYRAAGVIAARAEADGDAQSELLARFGRDPRWASAGLTARPRAECRGGVVGRLGGAWSNGDRERHPRPAPAHQPGGRHRDRRLGRGGGERGRAAGRAPVARDPRAGDRLPRAAARRRPRPRRVDRRWSCCGSS